MWTQLINTPDKSMCTKYIPPWFTFRKHLEKRNLWNSNSTLKSFTRTSGASIAWGDRQRHHPMSCGYSNSRSDGLERLRVPPITWVGLCPSSGGRCQDGKNAPSTQQARCIFFSIRRTFKHARHDGCGWAFAFLSLLKPDLISEEQLQTISELSGCSPQERLPSCATTPNLNVFRTATSVCNNRCGGDSNDTLCLELVIYLSRPAKTGPCIGIVVMYEWNQKRNQFSPSGWTLAWEPPILPSSAGFLLNTRMESQSLLAGTPTA